MIQDIAPHKFDITYRNKTPENEDIMLIYCGEKLLCRMEEGEIIYPSVKEISTAVPEINKRTGFLFRMELHGKERALQCNECHKVIYPTISPSVIVGVTDGERILLTKYQKTHSKFQKYALVAGYAEVGESLEDTVRREVFEEVGLKVKNIHYYKSQPWSFTDALLVGYFCETDGGNEITLEVDELSEAGWFSRSELPEERSEGNISLTGEMINAFMDGLV